MTLPELQEMRDTLIRALGDPLLQARSPDGKLVEFASARDINERLTTINTLISESSTTSKPQSSVTYAEYSGGTNPPW